MQLSSTRALFNRLIKPEVRRQLEQQLPSIPTYRSIQPMHPRPTTFLTYQATTLVLQLASLNNTTKANRANKNYRGHCRPQEWHSHIHRERPSERTSLYYRSAPRTTQTDSLVSLASPIRARERACTTNNNSKIYRNVKCYLNQLMRSIAPEEL
jgi:hypothetical protein